MKMKEPIRFYLIFALLFLFGASFAAGLYFAYEIELFRPLFSYAKEAPHLGDYVRLTASLLRPLCLVFLSGFTVYACAASALASLFTGCLSGQMLLAYCLS